MGLICIFDILSNQFKIAERILEWVKCREAIDNLKISLYILYMQVYRQSTLCLAKCKICENFAYFQQLVIVLVFIAFYAHEKKKNMCNNNIYFVKFSLLLPHAHS